MFQATQRGKRGLDRHYDVVRWMRAEGAETLGKPREADQGEPAVIGLESLQALLRPFFDLEAMRLGGEGLRRLAGAGEHRGQKEDEERRETFDIG